MCKDLFIYVLTYIHCTKAAKLWRLISSSLTGKQCDERATWRQNKRYCIAVIKSDSGRFSKHSH